MAFSIDSITDKDLRKLARRAVDQGWKVGLTGGNHVKFTAPNGDTLTTALTPSAQSTIRNFKAQMVRSGFALRTTKVKPMTAAELIGVLRKQQPEATVLWAHVDDTGKEVLTAVKVLRADGGAVVKFGAAEAPT